MTMRYNQACDGCGEVEDDHEEHSNIDELDLEPCCICAKPYCVACRTLSNEDCPICFRCLKENPHLQVQETSMALTSEQTDRAYYLAAQIDRADQVYYNLGGKCPGITDAEYDSMKREYAQLRPDDRVRLDRVGPPKGKEGFRKKTKHANLIGSLANSLNDKEFTSWWPGPSVGSPKIDGLTLVLTCEEGKVVRCVTRGNGTFGDDVTANAFMVRGIPTLLKLPFWGEIRGEVYLSKYEFDQINASLPEEERYKTSRNAASGILGSKDGQFCDRLEFLAHGIVDASGQLSIKDEADKFRKMERLGLTVVPSTLFVSLGEAMRYHARMTEKGRAEFPVELDGIVFTVNDLDQQKKMGWSGKRPKFATAFKFPSTEARTVLRACVWQLGDGGNLTPVAKIDPVILGGAEVTSPTLHNLQNIRDKDIAIGDTIVVVRSGDVIPFIDRVESRPALRKVIEKPERCPACLQPVDNRKNADGTPGIIIACENVNCAGLQKGMVMRWVKSLEIKWLGDEIIQAMMETDCDSLFDLPGKPDKKLGKVVETIPDLYTLPNATTLGRMLVGGKRLGESTASRVIAEINKTRELTIDQFLGSLSIHGLGKDRVKLIRQAWDSTHAGKDYDGLPGGGPTPGELNVVTNWFTNDAGYSSLMAYADELSIPNTAEKFQKAIDARRPLIEELLDYVKIKPEEAVEVVSDKLKGQTFCFTTCRMNPDQAKRLAQLGGEEKSGVSNGLSYLVQKDATKATSKSAKAAEVGTPVISFDQFLEMIK
jgi:DNA ligase (NAD+)